MPFAMPRRSTLELPPLRSYKESLEVLAGVFP